MLDPAAQSPNPAVRAEGAPSLPQKQGHVWLWLAYLQMLPALPSLLSKVPFQSARLCLSEKSATPEEPVQKVPIHRASSTSENRMREVCRLGYSHCRACPYYATPASGLRRLSA